MTEHDIAYAILFAWCGFSWGQWWAERRQKASIDVGLRMLANMLDGIVQKRKIVGRGLTISATHRFEILGEKLSIIVEAEGDPGEIIEGEVVK